MKGFFEMDSLPRYVFELKVLCDSFEIKYEIDKENKNFYYSSLDVTSDEARNGLVAVITDVEYQHPSWNIENSF